jgi:hypothetical protein
MQRARHERPGRLDIFEEPMPLVVEVWSPSTGDYDVQTELQQYQQRGDAEIWLVHPYDRTLTAWRRQPNGGYSETLYREGSVEPAALPGVRIESTVRCEAQTGAEMEALTAAAVAALTVIDMAKSADRWMTIEGLELVEKQGGKSGAVQRPG